MPQIRSELNVNEFFSQYQTRIQNTQERTEARPIHGDVHFPVSKEFQAEARYYLGVAILIGGTAYIANKVINFFQKPKRNIVDSVKNEGDWD